MTKESELNRVPNNRNLIIFSIFLLALLIASAFLYGAYVLAIGAVAIVSGGLVEFVFARVRNLDMDISWIVSPLVLTLMMPPRVNLWVVSVATIFGVFFGKSVFGGLGRNVFNPAVVGVLFVTISFPSIIVAAEWIHPSVENFTDSIPIIMLNGDEEFTYQFPDLLFGNVPGAIGETFRIGIIILGLALLVLKVADWRIPLAYLGSFVILTAIGHWSAPSIFPDPIMSLFVGGVLFAAFFIATDPVTAPLTGKGRIVYGIGLAFFTVLIRNLATFQEGVIFAVILMNAIAPLIDDTFNKNIEENELVEEAAQ